MSLILFGVLVGCLLCDDGEPELSGNRRFSETNEKKTGKTPHGRENANAKHNELSEILSRPGRKSIKGELDIDMLIPGQLREKPASSLVSENKTISGHSYYHNVCFGGSPPGSCLRYRIKQWVPKTSDSTALAAFQEIVRVCQGAGYDTAQLVFSDSSGVEVWAVITDPHNPHAQYLSIFDRNGAFEHTAKISRGHEATAPIVWINRLGFEDQLGCQDIPGSFSNPQPFCV